MFEYRSNTWLRKIMAKQHHATCKALKAGPGAAVAQVCVLYALLSSCCKNSTSQWMNCFAAPESQQHEARMLSDRMDSTPHVSWGTSHKARGMSK